MSDLATLAEIAGQARRQAGAENFPVALRLLPRRPRTGLLALYDYARFVDDVGDAVYTVDDHPARPADRLALLAHVDADLERLDVGGHVDLAPVRALAPLLAAGVPLQPFRDLVHANRLDQQVAAYPTFADLVGYCRYSANPVGLVVLHLAGVATPARMAASDAVCTALQVLEHVQDVGEDARAGRVYLPQADLGDVPPEDLRSGTTSRALQRAIASQVDRAAADLAAGRHLVAGLRGWARWAVAGFVAGGLATVDALRAAGYEVLAAPVQPSRKATAAHAMRLVVGR